MGGGNKTVETTQNLSPEQQKLLSLAMPAATDIAKNTPTLPQGSQIADFTPLQTAGQAGAVGAAGNIDNLVQGTIGANSAVAGQGLTSGFQGLENLISGFQGSGNMEDFITSGAVLDPSSNPFLQRTADAAVGTLGRELTQEVLPAVRGGAQTAGQVGSSRQGIVESLGIQDFMRQAGDTSANIFSTGYGQGLDALTGQLSGQRTAATAASGQLLNAGQDALGQAPTLANLSLLPSQVLSQVGGQQQALNQLMLSDDSNRFMLEQMLPFMISQDIANMASGIPGGSTTAATTGGGSSALQTILGIGSMIAGLPFPVG